MEPEGHPILVSRRKSRQKFLVRQVHCHCRPLIPNWELEGDSKCRLLLFSVFQPSPVGISSSTTGAPCLGLPPE